MQIVVEVDRLTAMTNDLLVLSHAENKPVENRPCDLTALVKEVFEQTKPSASEKGLEFTLVANETVNLLADPEQITQVVLNLITNAINYTPSGFVRVVLNQHGEFARFIVQDSGIGIAKEHHNRVFERFYRADKGRSKASGGTGLGLSIVKHILEAHGGHVEIESELNIGTTFTALIPLPSAAP
jgi:two-component system phosphate regulon sensor histidine kinase PhoR